MRFHDEKFLRDWLAFSFDVKRVQFEILLEQYDDEEENDRKCALRANIFSVMQSELEDLAMFMTALRKRYALACQNMLKESLLLQLLNAHTDEKLLKSLYRMINVSDVNDLLVSMGLPPMNQAGGHFWGYKPSLFLKPQREFQSILRVISSQLSLMNGLGRRMGNKIRHFGFIFPHSGGSLEVLIEKHQIDHGVLTSEQVEITRHEIPGDISFDKITFEKARELLEILVNAYLLRYHPESVTIT